MTQLVCNLKQPEIQFFLKRLIGHCSSHKTLYPRFVLLPTIVADMQNRSYNKISAPKNIR